MPPYRFVTLRLRDCYWPLRSFSFMAKNVTSETELRQKIDSLILSMKSEREEESRDLKELLSGASSVSRELKSAASRMESQLSQLRRKRKSKAKTTEPILA